VTRRGYIDWLRGVAVLIMIEAHTLDAWSTPAEHARYAYRLAAVIAGFAAPLFLFLAGVTVALAAGSRRRRGVADAEIVRIALRRGGWIFTLAVLLRVQSWVVSWGPFVPTVLKVDILHVMGLAMVVAALAWKFVRRARDRALALIALAAAVALAAPLVRHAAWVDALPTHLAWYFRLEPGWTQFTLFPWTGFLFAGAAIGMWLDAARTPDAEWRVNLALAAIGVVAAVSGYALSLLPPMYANVSFWTTSPTFFLLRIGLVMLMVAGAYAWNARSTSPSWLQRLGAASLFVYWIHLELVYGSPTFWLHRRLTFEQALLGVVVVTAVMYSLVRWKERFQSSADDSPLTAAT
jgi:uncharacterized membrane protein